MPKITSLLLSLLVFTGTVAVAQESMLPSFSPTLLNSLVEYAKKNYPRMKQYRLKSDEAVYNIKKAKLGWFEALTF